MRPAAAFAQSHRVSVAISAPLLFSITRLPGTKLSGLEPFTVVDSRRRMFFGRVMKIGHVTITGNAETMSRTGGPGHLGLKSVQYRPSPSSGQIEHFRSPCEGRARSMKVRPGLYSGHVLQRRFRWFAVCDFPIVSHLCRGLRQFVESNIFPAVPGDQCLQNCRVH